VGSLRNPIGPLPSSIYWRRRAVALTLLALVALLVVWAVTRGGSGGGHVPKAESKGSSGGSGPVGTITPGPSSTGPLDTARPGGRDGSDDGGTGAGGGTAVGGGSGSASGTGSAGGASAGGTSGGTPDVLGTGDGQSVPAGSSLPDCRSGAVELTVRSVQGSKVKNTYQPGEKPTFQVVVKNTSAAACAVDFGSAAASLTITDAHNDHVWASDDCPRGSADALVEVPGDGQTMRTVTWDLERSAAHCATPSGATSAKPGTYLVEAKVNGLRTAQVSFVLAQD
jgi:hypothetical protein